ncbi:hypothetical protein HPB48_013635 [Haemaphysalis longicornis]|uniref:Uncharacterized protein n=1 Tax=Haemaphysalis longicornis TaxID=44386 RepID=A0A9J6FAN0_HAELO|nr:hypothetical protein HPB48_013635 [Haemaphysalis longicornis]
MKRFLATHLCSAGKQAAQSCRSRSNLGRNGARSIRSTIRAREHALSLPESGGAAALFKNRSTARRPDQKKDTSRTMRTNATAERRHGCRPPAGTRASGHVLRLFPVPSSMLPLVCLLLMAGVALMSDVASADPSIGDVLGVLQNTATATPDVEDSVTAPPNKSRNERILEQWSKFELNLQDLVDSVIRKVLPTVIRRSSELDVSPDCRDALLKVVFGIRQLKRWAFQLRMGTFPPRRKYNKREGEYAWKAPTIGGFRK